VNQELADQFKTSNYSTPAEEDSVRRWEAPCGL